MFSKLFSARLQGKGKNICAPPFLEWRRLPKPPPFGRAQHRRYKTRSFVTNLPGFLGGLGIACAAPFPGTGCSPRPEPSAGGAGPAPGPGASNVPASSREAWSARRADGENIWTLGFNTNVALAKEIGFTDFYCWQPTWLRCCGATLRDAPAAATGGGGGWILAAHQRRPVIEAAVCN